MMDSQRRWHQCGQEVMYNVIDDAHGSTESQQFVYMKDGVPRTGSICPKCGGELTLENTTTLTKNRSTPEGAAFWDHVEATADRVRRDPAFRNYRNKE